MDRRSKMTISLDIARMTGVEIGPLMTPIVSKAEGQILYLDHVDTASLRSKYANDKYVRVNEIVDVDIVLGEQRLADVFEPDRKLDYILASHVIEHVPDLISWLEELRAVLKPSGRVNLAVPDKRFTFDFLREKSRLADILNAYLLRARRPLPHEILDMHLNCTSVDVTEAWDGTVEPTRLVPTATFDQALDAARDEMDHQQYHDVHCWVFTPQSFARLLSKLAEHDLVRFACDWFSNTEPYTFEFFVSLCPSDDRSAIVASWETMAQACTDPPKREPTLVDQVNSARQRIDELEAEREALCGRIMALERSTSWRITKPMRTVRQALNRRGRA